MTTSGLEGSLFLKTDAKSSKKWPDIQLSFFSASAYDDGSALNYFNLRREVMYKMFQASF